MILRNLGSNAKTCTAALFFLLALLMIPAPTVAQDSPPSADETAGELQAPAQVNPQDPPRERRDGKSIIEAGSPGMYLPLNGKSVKKFEKSLEEVQAETTPEEFITVQNALDYLLVYDLAARRDKKQLYKNLDGLTPAEVVGMVKWRLEGRPTKGR